MRTALVTLAILIVGAAPAAADDGVDGAFSTQTVADTYRSAHPEMTAAEAQKAAAEAQERKSLLGPLTEDGGLTFGGAWFDASSGVLHINATTPAAIERASQLGREKDLNVQTHLVPRSFAQLERQAAALRSGTGVLGTAADGQVGIDVRADKVVVAVPAEQRSSLLAAANAAGVKLIADPNERVEADVCTARDVCDGSLAAGAMLWRTNAGNFVCSLGFTAQDPFTLGRFVYTAGHCSNGINVTWGTGAQSIGPLLGSLDSGDIDASVIQVTNALYTGQAGGRLYNTDDVDSVVSSLSGIWVGDVVCKAANYQDPDGSRYCGEVGSVSDAAVRGMVRVEDEDACSGDSGGSWYWLIDDVTPKLRVGYGLHSRSNTGCRGDAGGDTSWFSALPTIKAGFAPGYNVETR
jgi:streptogrisin C